MDENEDTPDNKIVQPATPAKLQLLKTILEFISRCFYPAIIIFVLVLLQPHLEALLIRLQTFKAGGYEFTFAQAEDVGAETAPLNNKIVKLEQQFMALSSDLSLLQEKTGASIVNEVVKQDRAKKEAQFKANSQYTILVFYSSGNRSKAAKITDSLLQKGYRSSKTETDFSEIKKPHPPGTVYVSHNNTGKIILPKITEMLEKLGFTENLNIQKTITKLRRGEVQILVF